MGYYVRVLTKDNKKIPFEKLEKALEGHKTKLEIEENGENGWEVLTLTDSKGVEVCVVERDEVLSDSIGEEEIVEFLEQLETAKPKAAAKWLDKYLKEIKVIYAFEILEGIDEDEGYEAFDVLRNAIMDEVGGIFQADEEGFSNEEGFHILWQFEDDVEGPWDMAVLDEDGNWNCFEMELSDKKQIKEFLEGRVPKGAKPVNWQ